jgi:hypothetical protein
VNTVNTVSGIDNINVGTSDTPRRTTSAGQWSPSTEPSALVDREEAERPTPNLRKMTSTDPSSSPMTSITSSMVSDPTHVQIESKLKTVRHGKYCLLPTLLMTQSDKVVHVFDAPISGSECRGRRGLGANGVGGDRKPSGPVRRKNDLLPTTATVLAARCHHGEVDRVLADGRSPDPKGL